MEKYRFAAPFGRRHPHLVVLGSRPNVSRDPRQYGVILNSAIHNRCVPQGLAY